MPQFKSKRRVPYTSAQMFDLVADVERYPQFVPMCNALKVRNRSAKGEGVEVLTANMTVAYKFIRETFTSRVTLDQPGRTILVEYIDGPFSHLRNRWIFRDVEGGCEVEFFLDYEFKSRTLGLLMGAVFDAAFRRFAAAFEQRANSIYGKK